MPVVGVQAEPEDFEELETLAQAASSRNRPSRALAPASPHRGPLPPASLPPTSAAMSCPDGAAAEYGMTMPGLRWSLLVSLALLDCRQSARRHPGLGGCDGDLFGRNERFGARVRHPVLLCDLRRELL